jgi:hypothetical protein
VTFSRCQCIGRIGSSLEKVRHYVVFGSSQHPLRLSFLVVAAYKALVFRAPLRAAAVMLAVNPAHSLITSTLSPRRPSSSSFLEHCSLQLLWQGGRSRFTQKNGSLLPRSTVHACSRRFSFRSEVDDGQTKDSLQLIN